MRDLTPEELEAVYGGTRQVDTSILPRTPPSPAAPAHLTPRQAQCLAWVAAGKTSVEIGMILGLSHHSVNEHIEAACQRLRVSGRSAAVAALRAIPAGT